MTRHNDGSWTAQRALQQREDRTRLLRNVTVSNSDAWARGTSFEHEWPDADAHIASLRRSFEATAAGLYSLSASFTVTLDGLQSMKSMITGRSCACQHPFNNHWEHDKDGCTFRGEAS